MNRSILLLIVLAAAAAAASGGYWLGTNRASHDAAVPAAPADAARKVLYYRNPMGLPDTSPTPKKDSMGMDYIPVYEGEEPGGAAVKISVEKVQKLGVRTEAVASRHLARPVRAVGTLQVDERRLHTVAPRFEGWIERLHVNATAQPVAKGQPLIDAYSPDLISAQQEYLIGRKGLESVGDSSPEIRASMERLADSALQRLRNWDISEPELERLRRDGRMTRYLTLRAPAGGVVLEKPAIQGMRFMPGEALFKIADLSSLWLLAEVFEQDLSLVKPGQAATITVNAYPGKAFGGKVTFVYPTVNPQTRTAQVRIELPNPGGQLKPAMYASVELAAGARGKVIAVPVSAVLNSGTRQIVLVELAEGRYQPRPVKLGLQSDDYVEVLEGVGEGEKVVVSANFLIDAESNLKAALATFTAPGQQDSGAGTRDSATPAAAPQEKIKGR